MIYRNVLSDNNLIRQKEDKYDAKFTVYDYYALIDSCSFLKKYDALFLAFDMVYDQPDFPEVGRHGYRRSAYIKVLLYKLSVNIKCISDLVRDLESRPIFAEMCVFNAGRIPDASRFSRFLTDIKWPKRC